MKRRNFIRQTALASGGLLIMHDLLAARKEKVYGYNGMTYSLDTAWSKANAAELPVNDCHEMVQDSRGRIILLTNETKNNILIYNTDGKVLDNWGHLFPGGHGLTLHNENGTEFFYITDIVKHQVYKTTLDGKLLLTIDAPLDAGIYSKPEEFVPTETVIDQNGDIFIADGYGAQYILQYDRQGKLLHYFGGRGDGDEHLDNAHGICFDTRNDLHSLLVTDRTRNCFKRFSKDGRLLEVIRLPGACVCRPVIKDDHLYAAVLRSPDMNTSGTGFVTILDKQNKVVSNIGGSEPKYLGGQLQPMGQTDKIFIHPHDVCVDRDDNIYVAQWASGKVYPYKLTRANG
ncbi:MAG TPA: 6-bladed beta-propeller [Puia sp.]|jgi:hemin uptake protein HemP